MKRVYILVPGILTRTDDRLAWVVRMADDIMRKYPNARASEFRYFTDPIFRRKGQQTRARHLAGLIESYYDSEFEVVGVGHSNGCDLLVRSLQMMSAHVQALHLISAATEADFVKNGLNEAIEHGRIGRVVCYVSQGDSALSFWARLSNWVSLGLLGYGSLGWSGPQQVSEGAKPRVFTVRRDYLEHGDWFSAEHYHATLADVTGLEDRKEVER